MAGLTEQLAAIVAGLEFARAPGAGVDTAKRGVLDCLGVLLAGRDEPVVRIARSIVRSSPGGEARLLFDRGYAAAADAALLNGIAAHALDYDDTALDGHPSVVLTPVLLAEGERLGADGKTLIAAYLAGYETWAELLARDADKHHSKGWHPTAVFGAIAAAAAAARLARLDAAATRSALGLAASMSAGLVANFGSMAKPFQVGRAAQNGILAAQLAGRGMTAAPDAIEHPSGFLSAVSPAGRVRADGEIDAGRDWHILRHGLSVKRYPVCYGAHRAIDAVLELRARRDFDAESVAAVEVTIGRNQAAMLREHRPQTALQAKFSIEFAVACALLAGRVGLAELNDGFVAGAPVQAFFSKVASAISDECDPEEPLFAAYDRARITLTDGTVLESTPVRHARGHARNPIAREELLAKFFDCAGDALPRARAARIAERLERLEALPSVAALYAD